MWEESLNHYNTSFDEMMEQICDFIIHEQPDRVIVTRFEDQRPEPEHAPLQDLCDELGIELDFFEYGYGFYREEGKEGEDRYPTIEFNETWIQGKRDHHGPEDVLEIHDWQKELSTDGGVNVMLAGAFVNECLLDMQTILDHVGADYVDIDELQVGSGLNYEYKSLQEYQEEEDEEYALERRQVFDCAY